MNWETFVTKMIPTTLVLCLVSMLIGVIIYLIYEYKDKKDLRILIPIGVSALVVYLFGIVKIF